MTTKDIPTSCITALEQGRMIEAVKILRAERKIDLAEAKDEIDRFISNRPDLQLKLKNSIKFSIVSLIFVLLLFIAFTFVIMDFL